MEALIWGTAIQGVDFGASVLWHSIPPYNGRGKGFFPLPFFQDKEQNRRRTALRLFYENIL